jgi:hypothetical protein
MSEQAQATRVPFFAHGPAEVASRVAPDRGNDLPVAAAVFGGAIASYAVVIGGLYLALGAVF